MGSIEDVGGVAWHAGAPGSRDVISEEGGWTYRWLDDVREEQDEKQTRHVRNRALE
jgi:hypothetical protein